MGGALGIDETGIKGVCRRQRIQRFGDGVQNHGQFVIELVSGGSHDGRGAVGSGIPLHVRMIRERSAMPVRRRPITAWKC